MTEAVRHADCRVDLTTGTPTIVVDDGNWLPPVDNGPGDTTMRLASSRGVGSSQLLAWASLVGPCAALTGISVTIISATELQVRTYRGAATSDQCFCLKVEQLIAH